MAVYGLIDNFGENYGVFDTREKALEAKIDLIQMDLEDDGYNRHKYSIIPLYESVDEIENHKGYILVRKGDPEYIRFLPTKNAVIFALDKQRKEDKDIGIDFEYYVQGIS